MLPQKLNYFITKITEFSQEKAISDGSQKSASFYELVSLFQACHHFFEENFSSAPKVLTLLADHPSTSLFITAVCNSATAIPLNPAYTRDEISTIIANIKADVIAATQITDDILYLAETYDLSIIQITTNKDFHLAYFDLTLTRRSKNRHPGQNTDISLILHTSGSTGTPKCVPISSQAILTSASNIIEALGLKKHDIVVNMLPMFHVGAILDLFIVPLISGGHVRFAHPISTENLIEAIQDSQANWFQAVPTVLKALNDLEGLSTLSPNLRFVRSVSADLAPTIQNNLEQKLGNIPIVQMYGMTETTGQITSNPVDLHKRKIGSVGKVHGPDITLFDTYGNQLPKHKVGEVCVKGETVTSGYLNSAARDNFWGEWFRTGDLGYFDDENYLFLTGRTKDIINRGGEKISTLEIEQTLYELDEIKEVCVVAVPHASLGEDIACAVVTTLNHKDLENKIKEHLSLKLAQHKQISQVHFLEKLPKLGSGKIDKKAVVTLFPSRSKEKTLERPLSATGEKLAKIWKKTLRTDNVHLSDDFFETGGDSLMAQSFILKLEEQFNITVPTNFLYDAPTFKELEETLQQNRFKELSIDIPHDIFQAIKSMTASWKGARPHDQSLLISHNTSGQKPPFFFIAADEHNYSDIIEHLDTERPFYAMRTLSGLKLQNEETQRILAQHYVKEISEIHPSGPLFIGGFCKGAILGKMMTEEFLKQGRETALLFVLDRTFNSMYTGPALVAWSTTSEFSGRSNFDTPENGLGYLYPNKVSYFPISSPHKTCTRGKAAVEICHQLESHFQNIERNYNPRKSNGMAQTYPDLLAERAQAYNAKIKIKMPRFAKGNADVNVVAYVTNTSDVIWGPTEQSGLKLYAKWQRPFKRTIHNIAGSCPLNHRVAPGETIKLNFNVYLPRTKSPLTLMVDMADEGISWFQKHNQNEPARRKVFLNPLKLK